MDPVKNSVVTDKNHFGTARSMTLNHMQSPCNNQGNAASMTQFHETDHSLMTDLVEEIFAKDPSR